MSKDAGNIMDLDQQMPYTHQLSNFRCHSSESKLPDGGYGRQLYQIYGQSICRSTRLTQGRYMQGISWEFVHGSSHAHLLTVTSLFFFFLKGNPPKSSARHVVTKGLIASSNFVWGGSPLLSVSFSHSSPP